MTIRGIVPDIQSTRVDESKHFYVQVFGLRVAMDMGTVITFTSTTNETSQITLIRDEAVAS
jgi:catechol 2,3-dioxygenase-like lactoylglutathione lyase family enzyme